MCAMAATYFVASNAGMLVAHGSWFPAQVIAASLSTPVVGRRVCVLLRVNLLWRVLVLLLLSSL